METQTKFESVNFIGTFQRKDDVFYLDSMGRGEQCRLAKAGLRKCGKPSQSTLAL